MVSSSMTYTFTFNFFLMVFSVAYAFKFVSLRRHKSSMRYDWGRDCDRLAPFLKVLFTAAFAIQLGLLLSFRNIYDDFYWHIILISNLCIIFIILSFIIFALSNFWRSNSKKIHKMSNVGMFLFLGIANVGFVGDFITLLFILEIIGVIYYFFFLTFTIPTKGVALKYKNLLSYYLWSSFVILLVYSIFLIYTMYSLGTLNFFEISCLIQDDSGNKLLWLTLISIIFWKVGAPGFHFFKMEIYQFLPFYVLLMFSLYTLFVNFVILCYVIFNFYPCLIFNNFLLLTFVGFMNVMLLYRGSNFNCFYQFMAYSGVNTWGTLIMFSFV